MQSIIISETPDTFFCPVTGNRILAPEEKGESSGTWNQPGSSSALLFLWDNLSAEFTHCSPEAEARFNKAMAGIEAETGDEDMYEAFDHMIEAWEKEADSILHLIFEECGDTIHLAFDFSVSAP